jgi:hypothetical protein
MLTERTLCQGAISITANTAAQTVTCRFAALTQGAICLACPWNKLCSQLFIPEKDQRTVLIKAFSGMPIGELPITHETPKHLEVTTNRGVVLKFDKTTGLQVNAKNPKFANRIDV